MIIPPSEELDAIYRIVSQTSRETGQSFFCALVKEIAAVLKVSHSFISVFTKRAKRLKMLAYWNGVEHHTNFEYDLESTPCSELIARKFIHYPNDIQSHYPKDPHLKEIGAVSFRGVPLIGNSGIHFGHLAVIDTKEMEAEPRFITLMEIFAMRAVAELDRLNGERASLESERRLSAILDSAMDAVLVVDATGVIQIFNKAAERTFLCSAKDAIGSAVERFFSRKLAEELSSCLIQAGEALDESNSLWLQEGLTASRSNGEEFAIEATISRVLLSDQLLYTIILRDVSERVAAKKQIEVLCQDKAILEEQLRNRGDSDGLVGRSASINRVKSHIELVAATDSTVLILGETGTGKELVARAIHGQSSRKERSLVLVNCAALPETLIESDLFGHEKGAFTGATSRRIGRFERANEGTLFLDEIGELPLNLQSKLLRVLQEGEFERLGGHESHHTDVRVLAATNKDLKALVDAGEFRADLFYRLNVFPIQLPPLRERLEDLAILAASFEEALARKFGRRSKTLTERDLDKLKSYHWPGNIRELHNIIERTVLLSNGESLDVEQAMSFGPAISSKSGDIYSLQDMERLHIRKILAMTSGVIDGEKGAARLLDMNPSTLRSRMKKLGLQRTN